MTIPGPVFVIGFPLAVSFVLQLLRRWTALAAWLAAIVAVFVGLIVSQSPLDEEIFFRGMGVVLGQPLVLLGRALVIEPVDRLPLAFIFFTGASLFILAWRLLPHSNFFPIGLTMMALLSATLLVEQVVYAALLMEMAVILAIFPLYEPAYHYEVTRASQEGASDPEDNPDYDGEPTEEQPSAPRYGLRTQGGLRYMAYATLALPGLMITQLLLELFAIFPNDMGLLQSATVLLALSFAILLGAVPFQSWLSTVATDGSPPMVTFLFTVHLGTVWFMLLAYLETYSWLGEQALFVPLTTIVGLLMMVLGGALAASQRRLGRLVGYATLVDNGAMFVALGTRQVAGVALTVMMLIARPLALGLMTLGLDGLRRLGGGDDSADAVRGLAWRSPWRTMAFLVGGVAMAGFPLSLGFSARWGLYRLMVEEDLFQAMLALAGSAGVMMGVIAAIRTLLAPAPKRDSGKLAEDNVVLFLILLLSCLTFGLGLFPQWVSHVALRMAEEFTFFAP